MKENANKIYIITTNNLLKSIITKNKLSCIQKIRYNYCNSSELFLKNKTELTIASASFILFASRDSIKFDQNYFLIHQMKINVILCS